MIWLIFTVLLGLFAIGCVIVGTPGWKIGGVILSGFVWIILTLALSLHTVGQREVGIVQSFSGTIGSNYKSPGVVWAAPWNHVKKENVGLQKEIFVFDGGSGHQGAAVSKDQQPISAVLAVNFQVEPKDIIKLYKDVGPNWKSILLDGRIPQAFKETTAKFTSPEITLKRPQLRLDTLERLRNELDRYDIRVVDVFVSNVGYSEAYTQAIEAKQVQVQQAQQAQAKVAQSVAEANQAAAIADGEKRAAIAKAEGDARAIELQGKALKANPEVIRYQMLQKLAAQAKVIFCTTNNCPSILGNLSTP